MLLSSNLGNSGGLSAGNPQKLLVTAPIRTGSALLVALYPEFWIGGGNPPKADILLGWLQPDKPLRPLKKALKGYTQSTLFGYTPPTDT